MNTNIYLAFIYLRRGGRISTHALVRQHSAKSLVEQQKQTKRTSRVK